MKQCLVIGIAGGSGSGKTTLTNHIAAECAGNVTVVTHDNYYKAHDELSYDERCRLNYDHPNAFDTELLIQQLLKLNNNNTFTIIGPTAKIQSLSYQLQSLLLKVF